MSYGWDSACSTKKQQRRSTTTTTKKISWTQQDLTESQMTVLIILDLSPEPGLVSHELESLSPSQVTL